VFDNNAEICATITDASRDRKEVTLAEGSLETGRPGAHQIGESSDELAYVYRALTHKTLDGTP